MEIDGQMVKEICIKAGKESVDFAIGVFGDSINNERNDAFNEAIEIGIGNTVAALVDAKVSDDVIVEKLNKYWGINREEAIDRIAFEKNHVPLQEIREYLKLQGMTKQEVQSFMLKNNVVLKMKEKPELRELRFNPKKLVEAVKEGKK